MAIQMLTPFNRKRTEFRQRARRLGCVNVAKPDFCAQRHAEVEYVGSLGVLQVFRCRVCGWPVSAFGARLVTDDRDLDEPERRLFDAACAKLGVASQSQIRARSPQGHRRDAVAEVRAGFNERAPHWAQNRVAFVETFGSSRRLKKVVDELIAPLAGEPPLRFADIGCGTGGLLARVVSAHPLGHIAGVDVSPLMIAAAQERLAPMIDEASTNLDLIVSTAEHTPLRTAWFDLVTGELMLHHQKSPASVMAEMARITRPGGFVVVQVPGPGYTLDADFGTGRVDSPVGSKRLPGHMDPLGRFSTEELQEIARAAGLEPEHVDVDPWRYTFQSVSHCVDFLGRTGADARLRGYAGKLDPLNYGQFFRSGPVQIFGEFVTLTATKADCSTDFAMTVRSAG